MQIETLLLRLSEVGARLELTDGKLQCHAPPGSIDEALRGSITRNRVELVRLLGEQRRRGPMLRGIGRRPSADAAPLSCAQQRLWFSEQFQPGNTSYNIPMALRLEGKLDVAALDRAFNDVVRRHEALRTVFVEREGVPCQVVRSQVRLEL